MPYEIFDHTADIGIKICAFDLKGIFVEAGKALFDVITDITSVEERLERNVAVTADGGEELLVAWLNELLYLFEVYNLLFCDFIVTELDGKLLVAIAKGESFNEKKHVIKTAVKAVTYHQLEIREFNGKWEAKVILDI